MGGRKKWKVDLLSGRAAALLLLSGLFFVGSVVGCVTAGLVRDPSGALLHYVQNWMEQMSQGGAAPHILSVLWETMRFPILVVLLGFTAFGVVGLPMLFAIRGFLLCYAISVFYRILGLNGLVLGFVLFGVSAFLWMPVFFQLGVQGVLGSFVFVRRARGDTRCSLRCHGVFFACCALSVAVLCLSAALECMVVPILLQRVSGWLFSG